jgi:hypothetical protein
MKHPYLEIESKLIERARRFFSAGRTWCLRKQTHNRRKAGALKSR